MAKKQHRTKDETEQDTRPRSTTYKYSENGKGDLYESIILGGKSYFIRYNPNTDNVECCEEYGEPFRILVPPQPSEYSYQPYEFKDIDELLLTFLEAKKQTLDTLLAKANSIVAKYNDQDEYKLKTIASDVVWSYFQDRFPTTRYEVLTGGVGSGKSALADTYGATGYRPVNTTNPTAAVIYRILSNIEPGQCTMILEEAEMIDQNYEIMAILKTGYSREKKVDRTNPVTLKPEFFNSYCFKIIVAERSPNQDSGKGVIDRSFVHSCFKGYPQYDIKEILNPTNTGGPEHQALREELEQFRKVLLLYRLIHFKDDIPDTDIGIIGRDKELVKPTLQLFQGTESQDQLVETFQTILNLKNSQKATSLHSALLEVLISVIPDIDDKSIPTLDGKVELHAKQFWSNIPERIEGMQDEKRPGEYHSTEFGTLYKGTIGRILHDNFGVESRHVKTGSLWTVNRHKIRRLRSQLNSKIRVTPATAVTAVTAVTATRGGGTDLETKNNTDFIYNQKNNCDNYTVSDSSGSSQPHNRHISHREKQTLPPILPSPPSPPSLTNCPKCGLNLEENPFYARIHLEHCTGEKE